MVQKIINQLSVLLIACILIIMTIFLISCKNQPPIEMLTSTYLSIDNKNKLVYGEVDNDVINYSLNDKLDVLTGYSWDLYLDLEGLTKIPTNTFNLNIGDNVRYLLLTNNNQNDKSLYTLIIRRLPQYTIYFNELGATSMLPDLVVQEGDILKKSTIPKLEKIGYTFYDWDCENEIKVMEDMTITAIFTPNKYKVYYDKDDSTKYIWATYDDYCTLPIPIRPAELSELYTFKGYYTENNERYFNTSGKFFYNSPDGKAMKYRFTNDIYVHAVWAKY